MEGTIKALRQAFGFIRGSDGIEYFFHDQDLVDDFDLNVGDRVSFEPVQPQPEKGPRAQNVLWHEVGR